MDIGFVGAGPPFQMSEYLSTIKVHPGLLDLLSSSIYTGSFYRGSQDGKTCRFTWKSFTSNSWGKSETGLPGQQMQKN